jgi:hypothetical protein
MTCRSPRGSTTVARMISIRRALPVAAALALVLASCGGSSDGGADDAGDVEAPATAAETTPDGTQDFTPVEGNDPGAENGQVETVEEIEEEAPAEPVETAEPNAEPTSTAEVAEEPVVGEAPALGIAVSLAEWGIDAPTEYTAGEVTFTASNDGNFPHEFVVIEGEGYEALPLAEGGAVNEDELPTGALIGRTGRLGGGSAEALTVPLAPGNYVLLCNLGAGNNSHAGQGQRLDITVS